MFYIRIADLNIRINNRYEYVYALCKEYLIDTPDKIDMEVSATEEQIDQELVDTGIEVSRGYCEGVCIYRNICRELPRKFDAYLLHSALVEYDGRGYAFAARSGTGKSTHISLWKKAFGDQVRIINGDKPIVRYTGGDFIAYGTPWCGKEGLAVNDSVPLGAICFLERAEENSIVRISAADAVTKIVQQILTPQDMETLDSLFPLLDMTLAKVPCYVLKCNMDVEAAQVAYNGMKN